MCNLLVDISKVLGENKPHSNFAVCLCEQLHSSVGEMGILLSMLRYCGHFTSEMPAGHQLCDLKMLPFSFLRLDGIIKLSKYSLNLE